MNSPPRNEFAHMSHKELTAALEHRLQHAFSVDDTDDDIIEVSSVKVEINLADDDSNGDKESVVEVEFRSRRMGSVDSDILSIYSMPSSPKREIIVDDEHGSSDDIMSVTSIKSLKDLAKKTHEELEQKLINVTKREPIFVDDDIEKWKEKNNLIIIDYDDDEGEEKSACTENGEMFTVTDNISHNNADDEESTITEISEYHFDNIEVEEMEFITADTNIITKNLESEYPSLEVEENFKEVSMISDLKDNMVAISLQEREMDLNRIGMENHVSHSVTPTIARQNEMPDLPPISTPNDDVSNKQQNLKADISSTGSTCLDAAILSSKPVITNLTNHEISRKFMHDKEVYKNSRDNSRSTTTESDSLHEKVTNNPLDNNLSARFIGAQEAMRGMIMQIETALGVDSCYTVDHSESKSSSGLKLSTPLDRSDSGQKRERSANLSLGQSRPRSSKQKGLNAPFPFGPDAPCSNSILDLIIYVANKIALLDDIALAELHELCTLLVVDVPELTQVVDILEENIWCRQATHWLNFDFSSRREHKDLAEYLISSYNKINFRPFDRAAAFTSAQQKLAKTKFPVKIGATEILSLGHIAGKHDGPKIDVNLFQNKKNIFPVGFRSLRSYNSIPDPIVKVTYESWIEAGDEGPIFFVKHPPLGVFPGMTLSADSVSHVWGKVIEQQNIVKLKQGVPLRVVAIHGQMMFGLVESVELLMGLPGADDLKVFDAEISLNRNDSPRHLLKRIKNLYLQVEKEERGEGPQSRGREFYDGPRESFVKQKQTRAEYIPQSPRTHVKCHSKHSKKISVDVTGTEDAAKMVISTGTTPLHVKFPTQYSETQEHFTRQLLLVKKPDMIHDLHSTLLTLGKDLRATLLNEEIDFEMFFVPDSLDTGKRSKILNKIFEIYITQLSNLSIDAFEAQIGKRSPNNFSLCIGLIGDVSVAMTCSANILCHKNSAQQVVLIEILSLAVSKQTVRRNWGTLCLAVMRALCFKLHVELAKTGTEIIVVAKASSESLSWWMSKTPFFMSFRDMQKNDIIPATLKDIGEEIQRHGRDGNYATFNHEKDSFINLPKYDADKMIIISELRKLKQMLSRE